MKSAKSQVTPMDKLTAGYEDFIKGKKQKNIGKKEFLEIIKKAAKPKQHGSK